MPVSIVNVFPHSGFRHMYLGIMTPLRWYGVFLRFFEPRYGQYVLFVHLIFSGYSMHFSCLVGIVLFGLLGLLVVVLVVVVSICSRIASIMGS